MRSAGLTRRSSWPPPARSGMMARVLRSSQVERVIGELQRMSVHDPGLDVEALPPGTSTEQIEHHRGLIDGQNMGAEARRGYAEGAAPGCNVEEARARREPGPTQAFVPSHI